MENIYLIVLHYIVLYCIVLHCIVLYCIVLYRIVSYRNPSNLAETLRKVVPIILKVVPEYCNLSQFPVF